MDAWANIPPKRNRKEPICFGPYLYRGRNLVERFFTKIKQLSAYRHPARCSTTRDRRRTRRAIRCGSGCIG